MLFFKASKFDTWYNFVQQKIGYHICLAIIVLVSQYYAKTCIILRIQSILPVYNNNFIAFLTNFHPQKFF